VAVSRAGFPAAGSANAAVLARSDTFPDALAGIPLAVEKQGPLLLTPPTALDPRVLTELNRVLGAHSGKTVYLLGGTGALSAAVDSAVRAAGFSTVRLAGASRIDTALAIAGALGAPEQVFLATGLNFPDALAAGTAAGSYWLDPTQGGVVLLTQDQVLPTAVRTYLSAHPGAVVTTVGGQAAAAYPQADVALVGADRFETAELVALVHFGAATGVGVATGLNFPDALAGGAFLATRNLPLVLTLSSGLPAPTDEYVNCFSGSVNTAYAFGGTGVISDTVIFQVGTAIGLSWTPYSVSATTPAPALTQSSIQSRGTLTKHPEPVPAGLLHEGSEAFFRLPR
jgi:hypothetical protein